MSKKKPARTVNPEGLPTLTEVLGELGLTAVPDANGSSGDADGTVPVLPSWVTPGESAMMPPNLIEQLVIAHRERDAAAALYQQHENRRGGLFDGFLFAMGLPTTTTYDLATGMATVPKAE